MRRIDRAATRGLVALAALAALAALVALAGGGCTTTPNHVAPLGDGGVPSSSWADAGTPGAAVDGFITALASAMCGWQFRCCTLPEIDAIGGSSYVTPAGCRAATALGLHTFLGEARAAAASARVTFDTTIAEACVHSFEAGTCSPPGLPQDPWRRFDGCADPFVGLAPAGAACGLRDECVPGSRCVGGGQTVDPDAVQTPEGLTAPPTIQSATALIGSCLPYVTEDQPCVEPGDCAPGLYCRADTFVCARPAAAGEPCQTTSPLGLPAIVRPCDDARTPLVCMGGICGRLPQAGEPCLADGRRPTCDPDPALALTCVGARFNGSGICQPRGATGAVCGDDGLPTCAVGLACIILPGTTGVGACGPLPGLGAPCGGSGVCGPGTLCDGDSALCVRGKLLRDGMTCATSGDCASLACVHPDTNTSVCAAPAINQLACTGEAPAGAAIGPGDDGGATPDANSDAR